MRVHDFIAEMHVNKDYSSVFFGKTLKLLDNLPKNSTMWRRVFVMNKDKFSV